LLYIGAMASSTAVTFELILRADAGAGPPSVATAGRHRPDPAAVQGVRAWLAQQGIESHDAGFSVAASAPAAVFKRLFGGRRAPKVPAELARWVQSVELPPAPTLF